MRLIFVGLVLLVATAVSAAAQSGSSSPPQSAVHPGDVRITGQSRATLQVKRDILGVVAGYAKARHGCGTIASLETIPLPQGYEPKLAMFRVDEPQHFYERWVADLCGTKRAFLVALWPSPKGGADYKAVEVAPGTEP
jgi:hypothetical protein